MEYRVKEVKFPLKSGELTVFYPQSRRIGKTTTGYLWWRKTSEEKKWEGFYRHKKKEVNLLYTRQNDFSELLYFPTLREAQLIINEHEKWIDDEVKKSYIQKGIDWNDERYVKIHEPTS